MSDHNYYTHGKKNVKPGVKYIKYTYWFTESEDTRLRESLSDRGINIKTTVGIPCAPLDPINRISRVTPDVWNQTCVRQGSWYRKSKKNGLYLIISSFELKDNMDRPHSIITASDFEPPRYSSMKEKIQLVHEREFMEQMPLEWMDVSDREKSEYLRWAGKMENGAIDFETLFITHSANHANFIKPHRYIEKNGEIIPYSIDRSAYLCSCCLELFQVIGEEYAKKYVSPCSGACVFARLESDRYLLVQKR